MYALRLTRSTPTNITRRLFRRFASISALQIDATSRVEDIDDAMSKLQQAQDKWMSYSQRDVDRIFTHVNKRIKAHALEFAKYAVEESGIGRVEDKVLKNLYASEYSYAHYKDLKTAGVIETNEIDGITKVAEPVGPVCAIVPCTNPACTIVLKALYALKTRNAIMFLPHPRTKICCAYAANLIEKYAQEAGAPPNSVMCALPSVEMTKAITRHKNTKFILATGGPAVINIAYTAGKPAIGVGAGNAPALVDESYDTKEAMNSIVTGRTFDNGTICAGEQSVVIVESKYEEAKRHLRDRGVYILNEEEKVTLAKTFMPDGKGINPDIVGKSPQAIAELAGLTSVPKDAVALCVQASNPGPDEIFSHEKLSPILALFKARDFDDALNISKQLVNFCGAGHTSALYTDPKNTDRIARFRDEMPTYHQVVNMPSSMGVIGIRYNFASPPTFTVGVGSRGGSVSSLNVGPKELIQVKNTTVKRDYVKVFRTPVIFSGHYCVKAALQNITSHTGGTQKRALLISDGTQDVFQGLLAEQGWSVDHFVCSEDDVSEHTVQRGVRALENIKMKSHNPVVFAIGSGTVLDMAKMIKLRADNPDMTMDDLLAPFMESRWRDVVLSLQKSTKLVTVPTSLEGSEVTSFTGLPDTACHSALQPDYTIRDEQFLRNTNTREDGFKLLVQTLETYISANSTEESRRVSASAFKDVLLNLEDSLDGNNEVATHTLFRTAGQIAVHADNVGLGLLSAFAIELEREFQVNQADAMAVLFSHVLTYSARKSVNRVNPTPNLRYPVTVALIQDLTTNLGVRGETEDESLRNLIGGVRGLAAALSLPSKLSELGTQVPRLEERLDKVAEMVLGNIHTSYSPILPTLHDLKQILLDAL